MSAAEQRPMNLRLPRLAETTAELIDLVAQRSPNVAENKHLYMQGPGRYAEWLLWAHDPELLDATWGPLAQLYGMVSGAGAGMDSKGNAELLYDEDQKKGGFERWALMMAWQQMRLLDNQYTRTVVLDILTEGTSITRDKLMFIDQPDCDMWNDDERLVLRFAEAAFTFKMTDEIFAEAFEAWGAPFIFDSLYLCAQYYGLTLILSTSGCDRYVGLDPSKPLRDQTGWPDRDPSVPGLPKA